MDLVDAVDLVFHRVFNGNDFDFWRIEFGQRGVQRGGFARTGWAGDQQNAVRLLQHFLKARHKVFAKPQFGKIQHHGFAVQQAHHHRLTVRGGNTGHTQIQLLALHSRHDAAVLWQAALGDIELGHDLDAADDGGGQIQRRAFAFFQHPVDAVTHLQARFEGLDMDVGCAHFHRALDDQIHQPNDRRFRG